MERRFARVGEQQMPRAVSRKNFLMLGGVGLAGAALLAAAGCGRSRSGAVRFLDETTETTALERAVQDIIQGSRTRTRTSMCNVRR